jgi:hypothetical protein
MARGASLVDTVIFMQSAPVEGERELTIESFLH